MSVAVGTALSADPASWSIGPRKIEIQALAVISGDVTATVTANSLSRVDYAVVCVGSLTLTAAPTYSGAVASLAFTDPAANRFGTIILFGV